MIYSFDNVTALIDDVAQAQNYFPLRQAKNNMSKEVFTTKTTPTDWYALIRHY